MDAETVISNLNSLRNPKNVEGMARFGINPEGVLGVSMPALRKIGKSIGKDHKLAIALWDSGIHEARILASLIDDPGKVDEVQAESWVKDFDSWAVCDQVCANLLWKTPFAWKKARSWTRRDEEFVKRAGFALMAVLAVHDKKAKDRDFIQLLAKVEKGATDERNFVRKAVNWALRQIGKRNLALNKAAVSVALGLSRNRSKAARWIATDALRELESEAVGKRLSKKG